jgi:transposase InsO family protein
MPWKEVSTMSLRYEFVVLASEEGVNMTALCARYGISPKTGYKWLKRYRAQGKGGLQNQPKRPLHSPNKSSAKIEEAVLLLRRRHPAWGGRKLRTRLQKLGHRGVPSASTITAILRRHGCLSDQDATRHTPWQRFEHAAPNALLQMDFKGHFAVATARCHALTILDDHSRFALCVKACGNEQGVTVQTALTETFRRYGLPERMTMDNGNPWRAEGEYGFSGIELWLIRLGIVVSHSRPYHPQTQGKDERFHRTLQAEVLNYRTFRDLVHCQKAFDTWRDIYNLERPHEALGMEVPAGRYRPSQRTFPDTLPSIDYGPDDIVRKVQAKGELFFRGHIFRVSRSLRGYPVALRPRQEDGAFSVFFCHQRVAEIDLRYPYE